MIIENESNWRTEDLLGLLESVRKMEGFQEGFQISTNTLFLFTTSRRKATKNWEGEKIQPPAADYEQHPSKFANTVIVKICSGKRLEMEVLDRIAHIGDDYEQDMKASDVELVARCIGKALGSWRMGDLNYSWARKMPMRLSKSGNPRSKTAVRRAIDKLEESKWRIDQEARRQKREVDEKIQKLRTKL